ncbi:MAG: M48 family metalloprotease [Bdellovibrionota bacterium]
MSRTPMTSLDRYFHPAMRFICHRRVQAPSFRPAPHFFNRALCAFVALTTLSFVACAPSRQPVPPGVVPKPKALSVTDEQYGHKVFQELADHYEQDYNNPRAVEVQDIVDRLSKAAGAGSDPWHVYIFKDATVKNAAATRGNHVFIWSGMLDSTKSEAELATILAHEMSHVLAGHTDPDPNEETKRLLIAVGAMAAGIAVSAATHSPSWGQNVGDLTSSVTNELGNSLLLYPYSREKELEADQIGLFLMADAKYDPQAAIEFWSRAQHDPDMAGSLSFLSTHPPAQDRLAHLQALLTQAEARYHGMPYAGDRTQSVAVTNGPQSNPVPVAAPNRGHEPSPRTHHGGPPPSSPDGDSFAFGSEAPSSSLGPPAASPTTRWTAKAQRSYVFEKPTASAKKLGELSRGARVEVIGAQGAWLEIDQPDHGFVQRGSFEQE